MLYQIAPFIMIIATTWITAMVLVQLLRYRIKRKIIEAGMVDPTLIKAILTDSHDHRERQYRLLKWIFISAFGGIGLIVQEFLPYKMEDSALPYGVIIVFLSIGLLLNFILNELLSKRQHTPEK
ncbi:hypothetical protein AQF98_12935 [Pedobacter sp. Hv1]|nr:hypothetical protein AQF98_12935 [Pedobacter sp. Hv1]